MHRKPNRLEGGPVFDLPASCDWTLILGEATMGEEREEPILPASCDWTLILREATMGEEREEPILLTSEL